MTDRRRSGRALSSAERLLASTVVFDAIALSGGASVSHGRHILPVTVVVFGVTLCCWLGVVIIAGQENAAARPDPVALLGDRPAVERGADPAWSTPGRPPVRPAGVHGVGAIPDHERSGASAHHPNYGGPAPVPAAPPAALPPGASDVSPAGRPGRPSHAAPVHERRVATRPPAGGGQVAYGKGEFPVLTDSSRAADAPWLLPREPTLHAVVADEAVLGGLRVRAASVVGPGHRSQGISRQDAYRLGQDDHGRYLIIAVADGMSDARHSEVGASAAVTAVVAELRKLLNRGEPHTGIAPGRVLVPAAAKMISTAKARGWTSDDMRAVVAAAVVPVRPDARGGRRVWLACVGDPGAWRLRNGSWERLLGGHAGQTDGAIADNHVESFLPFDVAAGAGPEVRVLSDGDVLTLMTDGVADALEQVHGGRAWFAERWRQPPPVGSFLLDVGFKQVQMQDDRTAVAVWLGRGEGAE